jgi:sporulation protein YlmC with PRC-barrel domain
MTERTGSTGLGLVRLSDSELVLVDQTQDVRGLDVYDKDGDQIGTVEDLYADEKERKVRFLDVGAGGFLGLGEKHFLVPVEAVAKVDQAGVTVDQSRERVAESPPFDADVVPQPPTSATTTTTTATPTRPTPGASDTGVPGVRPERRRGPDKSVPGKSEGSSGSLMGRST